MKLVRNTHNNEWTYEINWWGNGRTCLRIKVSLRTSLKRSSLRQWEQWRSHLVQALWAAWPAETLPCCPAWTARGQTREHPLLPGNLRRNETQTDTKMRLMWKWWLTNGYKRVLLSLPQEPIAMRLRGLGHQPREIVLLRLWFGWLAHPYICAT